MAESKLAALTAPELPLLASTAPQTVEPTTGGSMSRWRRHLPWLIAAAVLTVMVLVFVLAPGVR